MPARRMLAAVPLETIGARVVVPILPVVFSVPIVVARAGVAIILGSPVYLHDSAFVRAPRDVAYVQSPVITTLRDQFAIVVQMVPAAGPAVRLPWAPEF